MPSAHRAGPRSWPARPHAEEAVGTTDCREIDETCVRVHGTVMQEWAAADRNENVKGDYPLLDTRKLVKYFYVLLAIWLAVSLQVAGSPIAILGKVSEASAGDVANGSE